MNKYHFIKCEYKLESQEPVIFLIGRNKDTLEKKIFRVIGFQPRFYVPENEPVPQSSKIIGIKSGFKSIFNEPCKQITVKIPSDVKELRAYFKKSFQADIPFTRLYLIESGIRTFFEVLDDMDEIHFSQVKGE